MIRKARVNKKREEQIQFANKELIENGNLGSIDEIFTSDYVAHNNGKHYKGYNFIKRWVKQIRSSIPDVKIVRIVFHIHAEDTIAWQRFLSGTHKTSMRGVPPSGKKVTWSEMIISRFDGDRIAEEWVVSELAGELFSKQPLE